MKKSLLLLTIVLPALLLTSGCYTMLKPPDEAAEYSYDEEGNCIDCPDYYHEDYGYSYYYVPNYWVTHPRWGHYYATPWWYDYNVYDDGDRYYESIVSPRSSQPGKAVRPGGRWQEAQPSGTTPPRITRGAFGTAATGTSGGTAGKGDGKSGSGEVKTKSNSGDSQKETKKKSAKKGGRFRTK